MVVDVAVEMTVAVGVKEEDQEAEVGVVADAVAADDACWWWGSTMVALQEQ